MPVELTRREMLTAATATGIGLFLGDARTAFAAPRAKVESITVISKQPELYIGWPTLARRKNGQLLLTYSGGREAHVCPFGRVEMMTSDDDGRTWTWPRVLHDSAIDDRDSGVLETSRGSILVTTFSSLAYEPILEKAETQKPGDAGAWAANKLARWKAARDRIGPELRKKELGTWMLRSTDGGLTWSTRYDSLVNSPHGPVELSDGRLLYAGKELWKEPHRVGVCESTDDGQSWRWLATIPTRPGDDHEQYHELHAVEATGGRLIVHIRNHNKEHSQETLQSESDDGGKTWSVPHSIGVWGYPSHLLRLKDGRLLMSYGHRRKPLGNQARLSEDRGRTWSDAMLINDDAASGDMGYPSTVQLADGSLVTVWYELMSGSPRCVLRQAQWSLAE